MFRQLVQKINHTLLGRPSRIVVEKYEGQIALSIFQEKRALSLSQLVEHYPAFSTIAQILSPHDDWYIIPLAQLDYVKKFLRHHASRGLELSISAEVDRLRQVERPPLFEVVYFWSQENERIERYASGNALYFNEGCFVIGDHYWHIKGTTDQDDYWLRKKVIEGPEMVQFVTQVIPDWYRRELPYHSYLKYKHQPLLSVTITKVKEDSIIIDINWNEITDEVREIPSLPNHIIMADWIMPGIVPSKMIFEELKTSGRYKLSGQGVALFIESILPSIKDWVQGQTAKLQAQHPIIEHEGYLILSIERKYYTGIGLASAVPTFVCGHVQMAAENASKELELQKMFIRVEEGWLPTERIKQARIALGGRTQDGTPLAPITLTPLEVINRGSERLQGPWVDVKFPPLQLQQGKSMLEQAYLHLELLRTWGIPGGLIGTMMQYNSVWRQFFFTFTMRYPEARVLIVGFNRTLNLFGREWANIVTERFDGKHNDPPFNPFMRGVILARPRALEAHPEMLKTEWNILCLLEADRIIKSDKVKTFRLLVGCRKMLTMGLFNSRDFLNRKEAAQAISQLFELPTDEQNMLVWHYGLRDPMQPPPKLPPPYPLQKFNYVLPSEKTDRTPESQSRLISTRPDAQRAGPTIDFIQRQKPFVEVAKERVNHYAKNAHFSPFRHLWPSYNKMNRQQSLWYFYWRDQVRKGNYLDTDSGYIMLHSYELIHNIGVKNALDGYLQLRQLWLSYRKGAKELDSYMIDWLADYVVINDCSIDATQIYTDEAAFDYTLFYHPDLLLGQYLERPLSEMPLALIEKLTDYELRKSKFYNSDHGPLLEEYIPKVLDKVNEHMVKSSGEGIFERFRPDKSITIRRPRFMNALYGSPMQELTVTSFLPYTTSQPLKYLLTGIVKDTENKLRKKYKVRGRLRNYTVEPAVEKVIERTINPPAVKQKIKLDLAEIERLSQESEQIFEMLQVEEQEAPASPSFALPESQSAAQSEEADDAKESGATSTSVATNGSDQASLPASDNKPSQGSLDEAAFENLPEEWAEFASQLTNYQFQILRAIITENDPSTRLNQIAEANAIMTEMMIDALNEIALETIGDIVIDAYPIPHIIEEEYVEAIQEMVAPKGA